MGLFWRRKGKDEFVTLGLNQPQTRPATEPSKPLEPPQPPPPIPEETPRPNIEHQLHAVPEVALPSSGGGPTPIPVEPERPQPRTAPPPRSSFSSSVLGLDLSVEELQAREAALEQEFSARFRRAVAATRESLSEKLDTVFVGRKQIDDELLDQLEEALIAADIGVSTTLQVLENVRRGIARKQINDLDALKAAIKSELLNILKASTNHGGTGRSAGTSFIMIPALPHPRNYTRFWRK